MSRPVRLLRCLALALMALAWPASARADLVFFPGGRTLSIQDYRVENGWLVLALRGGGEMRLETAAIERITPDEVPFPDPEPDGSPLVGPMPAPVPAAAVVAAGGTALDVVDRFTPIIQRASTVHGVDPRLVRAVIQVESAFQERARSRRGAMGLMQLMPSTARQYSVRNPYDAAANVEAGTRHLKTLLSRFPLALALAAYNAGEGAVERFGGIPPFPETRSYVARILQLLRG